MTVDLTGLAADAIRGNADAVAEVEALAAGLSGAAPIVLLPVRLETRFLQAEVPIAGPPPTLIDLAAHLADATRPLAQLAALKLSTSLAGLDKNERIARKGEEEKLYAAVEERLTLATDAIEDVRVHARDPHDAGRGGEKAIAAAITAHRAAISGAADAIATLRSEFQRKRFAVALDELAGITEAVLTFIVDETVPAALLRGAFTTGRTVAGPRVVIDRGPSLAGRPAPAVVPHDLVTTSAATYPRLLEAIESVGDDPQAIAELQRTASTVALLPATWKRTLTEAAQKLDARTLTPGTRDLLHVIEAIRSGDATLDARVPLGDVPIRVSTGTRIEDRLVVRIFPDDLAVDTHEEALTQAEREAGITFWLATLAAGEAEADEEKRRAAWRALCLGRGTRRAAWIARELEPEDPAETDGAAAARKAERLLDALDAALRRLLGPSRVKLATAASAAKKLATLLKATEDLPAEALTALRSHFARTAGAAHRVLELRPLATLDEASAKAAKELERAITAASAALRGMAVEPPPEPVFPAATSTKDGAWTRAATAAGLPTRFVVVAVAGGQPVHVVAGAPVDPDLALSVDPAGDDADPNAPGGFAVDPATGELRVASSIRWMVDLGEAHAKGMAVTIPITPAEAAAGFERVYVVGLAGDASAADGAARLEALLDNHHFGETGLGLVGVGTPTNNTEAGGAGFTSDDDPDAAFSVERGASQLGAPAAGNPAATDGARLASALGVSPDTFAHIHGATGTHAAEGETMARALWPATLGSWLEDHGGELVPPPVRRRLRAFATAHVSGRGLVPAFRIGQQPYGVLPTTAYSVFAADAADAPVPANDAAAQLRFDRLLARILGLMREDWEAVRRDKLRIATDPPPLAPTTPESARSHFLQVLGLGAVASSGASRFGVNVAGRHGPPSLDPSLRFDLPPNAAGATQTAAAYGPFALLERFDPVLRDAFGVAFAGPLRDADGKVSPELGGIYQLITSARGYELRYFDRTRALSGPLVEANPTPALEAIATGSARALLENAWNGRGDIVEQGRDNAPPRSLLVLLARYARLAELRDAALEALVEQGFLSEGARLAVGASGHYSTGGLVSPMLTGWTYLLEPLGGLWWASGSLNPPFATGGALIDRLTVAPADAEAELQAQVARVSSHAADLTTLAELPKDRLEILFGEQLDLVSHRLDAWLTGLAQRRLTALRSAPNGARGAHVAAYGWVDDLTPKSTGRQLATGVPDSLVDPARPIYTDDASQGFVHAPSINHAVTAAILRSGYVSQHRDRDVQNRMAVNLSSRRTRIALSLIDGVRAGNTLGALLGYRLERFLHDHFDRTGVTLDALIGPLRSKYPTVSGVDEPVAGATAARQVCDGLRILDAVQGWIAKTPTAATTGTIADVLRANLGEYPWELNAQSVPARGAVAPAVIDGLILAIDHVADALDAVADLVIAEGVHQLARGNHARAAAVLAALAEGKAPPRPEVVDTPRTGTPVVHRVLLQLPTGDTLGGGWEALPLTPRAAADPALNAWLATLLGDPTQLRLRIVNAATGRDHQRVPGVMGVSVADLRLQPIDLVAILGPGLETGLGELAARALDASRPLEVDDLAPPPRLEFDRGRAPSWDDDVRGVLELAPLLESLGGLIGRARPATAHDYVAATPETTGASDGVDLAELGGRVGTAGDALLDAALALAELLAGRANVPEAELSGDPRAWLGALPTRELPAWADRELWRTGVLDAAAFGITAALPPAEFPDRLTVRTRLREAAETAFVEAVDRLHAAADHLDGTPDSADLTAAARALFGEAFVLVPQFAPSNEADVDAALAAGLASPAEIDGWLQGAGMVREATGALTDVLVLADAEGAALATPAIAQLPHDPAKPEPWVGGRLGGAVDAAGRLSLAILGDLEASGSALLVDTWTEEIPSRTETTGVAVHYDQPDATPPQCVLVAVPPVAGAPWSVGLLAQTLHDTFELAQIRAVELEHLADTLYGQLLPAISGELLPSAIRAANPGMGPDRMLLDVAAVRGGGA